MRVWIDRSFLHAVYVVPWLDLMAWSWVLAALGVTTVIIAGRKKWWAWPIGILTEALWVYYSIISEQYGFIVASFAYIIVYFRNTKIWYKDSLGGKA